MGKKKTPFFERLIAKNAEQENKDKNSKKGKSKSWKITVASILLIATISAGIIIPFSIKSNQKKYIEPLKGNTLALSSGKLNIDIDSLSEKTKEISAEEKLKAVDKMIIYYLYDIEQKASEDYQNKWNESKKGTEPEVNKFRLPTREELKNKFTNEIRDQENNLKVQFGAGGWEAEFNKYLVEKFNGAKTIEEAVEKRIFAHIRRDALRRFRFSPSTDKKDEIERVYQSGNNEGKKVFEWWSNSDTDKKYIELEDASKLAFSTDSYVFKDEWKNGKRFIEKYLEKEKPYLISEFSLPINTPEKRSDKESESWSIDKKIFLKYLFAIYKDQYGQTDNKFAYDVVKTSFKPFDHYMNELFAKKSEKIGDTSVLPDNVVNYSTILNDFSTSAQNIKNNWGTSGLTSISELLSYNSFHKFLADSTNLLVGNQNDKIKTIDLFGELEKIRVNIAKAAGLTEDKYDLSKLVTKENIAEYNTKIKDFFEKVDENLKTGLTKEKTKELILEPLAKLFEEDDKKIQTVYKIKDLDHVFAILTPSGLKLLNFKKNIKYEDIMKTIESDFKLSKKYEKHLAVKYDALSKINKELSRNEYILEMLKNEEFKKHLFNQTIEYAKNEKGQLSGEKYNEETIKDLITVATSGIEYDKISNFIELVRSSSKWMNDRANNKYDEFFTSKDGKTYFTYNQEKTASSIALDYMKSLFLLKEKRSE
ncbi:HinT-interacting membrane complex protein P80 [Mycoplasma tauri]|uniref:HinT-interacting membrane complex protein P80 n=1 Tax=Mycoplasma tauri TaxID=547987 RepID=UPI001CBFFA95|nr:hypothetical protein [Mycoplasma tauri]MBZ4203853.1 hypothetical protein [Mycoplasma tauri]